MSVGEFKTWPVEFGAQRRVAESDLRNLPHYQLETFMDEEVRAMVLRIRAQFARADKPIEQDTVEFPETWIDAVKLRWFPAWARRRWPIGMRRVVTTAYRLCPHAEIPWSESSTPHVFFLADVPGFEEKL